MYKILNYFKYLSYFIILIIIITLITSFLNLLFKSPVLLKTNIILTAISFFIISSLASKKINEKGYILGIKLGLLFIISLIIINLILFKSNITINRIIYYIILLSSSILGGSFGKNFKINLKKKER